MPRVVKPSIPVATATTMKTIQAVPVITKIEPATLCTIRTFPTSYADATLMSSHSPRTPNPAWNP